MVTSNSRTSDQPRWLLLVYKVPHEPSARRVYVWRKLKRLGAILLHDALWVLPVTAWTRHEFQWLTSEIQELGGEATVWEARLLYGRDDELIQQFLQQVEKAYTEILQELHREEPDLVALSRRYQLVHQQDYFQSEIGLRARAVLNAAQGGADA